MLSWNSRQVTWLWFGSWILQWLIDNTNAGACDCGDPTAWKAAGCCPKHSIAEVPGMTPNYLDLLSEQEIKELRPFLKKLLTRLHVEIMGEGWYDIMFLSIGNMLLWLRCCCGICLESHYLANFERQMRRILLHCCPDQGVTSILCYQSHSRQSVATAVLCIDHTVCWKSSPVLRSRSYISARDLRTPNFNYELWVYPIFTIGPCLLISFALSKIRPASTTVLLARSYRLWTWGFALHRAMLREGEVLKRYSHRLQEWCWCCFWVLRAPIPGLSATNTPQPCGWHTFRCRLY